MTVMNDHDRSHDLNIKPLPATTDKSSDDMMTIVEFFAHKNVFITGGTGFLGTVLIEALLDVSPDIGTIYVLIRGKKHLSANDRLQRLLQKPIFHKYNEKTLAKVKPIVGELSEVNFNLSDDDMNELIDRVNIIYHIAATIKFSAHLRTAIKTNLTGTMRTIELAKRVKNLTAYVYCSTAFCNCNNSGLIVEKVYKSKFDPYEMMKIAEDDSQWDDFTEEKCKEYICDHPNTYTFTKNLSENLLMAEMKGIPTAIVRPSIVYGTWEKPLQGWVGNANSGHLGFIAGFIKGIFRTIQGRASAVIDIIPCDYVINSSLVMGWYVGTRHLEQPEVIHCTAGEVNPLTLGEFCKYVNESVKRHPPNNFVWKPRAMLRNGWRYNIFFYLFHMVPAVLLILPEKLLGLGMKNHTAYDYMLVFLKGTKAFHYFMDKDFRYDFKNSLRIMTLMHESDRKRYNFDASQCNWAELFDRITIGVRRFYFKEAAETTAWHRNYWRVFNVIYYLGYVGLYSVIYLICVSLLGFTIGFPLALLLCVFLAWL